jgi:hypothetical protein
MHFAKAPSRAGDLVPIGYGNVKEMAICRIFPAVAHRYQDSSRMKWDC